MVPYDASASVPMVIYDARPGRQNPTAGPTIERTTQLIDIFPTLAPTDSSASAPLRNHTI